MGPWLGRLLEAPSDRLMLVKHGDRSWERLVRSRQLCFYEHFGAYSLGS